jgi:heptosyltransferase-2
VTSILVKAPNWVGDCVMATPALEFLRRAFPEARIDVLARPSVAAALTGNPHASSVIAADDRKLAEDVRSQLRAAKYDAVALLPNSLSSAWLAFKLRIPRRIGFSRGGRGLLLTQRIPYRAREWQTPTPRPLSSKSIPGSHPPPGSALPRHMVHYYMKVAHETALALGGRVYSGEPEAAPSLTLTVDEAARTRVEQLLAERGLTGKALVGINPGAAYGGAKRWPAARLGQVADAMAAEGAEIVSTASKYEAALAEEVEHAAKCKVHRLGEELSLLELTALLQRLRLFITNDSGPMHMAAALGVPTVSIFGPTDWNVTAPWSRSARIVRQSPQCAPCFLRECPIDHRCMQRITAEQVIAAAGELLAPKQQSTQEQGS